jgi:uncharacterized paraquat-inducible protein A
MLDQRAIEAVATRLWRRAHPFLYVYELHCPDCGAAEILPAVEHDLDAAECDRCGALVRVQAALPRLRGDGYWLFPAE